MQNKNFLTKSRWLVTIILFLSLGTSNAWGACDETGLTASPGVFVLDFYNCSQLSSTSGTSLTTANCRTHTIVPTGITTSDVITGVTNSNNSYVRYDMNGGLTLGYGTAAKIQTTLSIGSNFPVRKITVVGAAYDSSVPLYVAGTSVTLNSKGTQYTSCSNSTTITPSPYITSIVIKQNNGSNKKRSTLYTAVCEYGYRAYLTAPGTGSISATPKTANENGAGWNGTENAVVGLKSGQKVTLSATPPSGYTVGSWTVKKKSDNSDITASVLSGTTLTMPAYDVKVSVTWEASGTSVSLTKAGQTNGSFTLSNDGPLTTTTSQSITLTASPNTGYYLSNVTASNPATGTATVTGSGNTRTITYSSGANGSSTITTTFSPIWELSYGVWGDSWGDPEPMAVADGVASCTLSLSAMTKYGFKFHNAQTNTWYGNSGGVVITDISNWEFPTDGMNCRLFTGPAGNYTFSWTIASSRGAVSYPSVSHPSAGYAYFKKQGSDTYIKVYTHHNDEACEVADWAGSVQVNNTTSICNNDYFYFALTDAGGCSKAIIRYNNASEQKGDFTITSGAYSGKWGSVDDTDWHTFDKYTITFAGNGNSGGSMSNVSNICPGSDVTLVTNGYTKTNYNFTGWKTNAALTYVANGDADDGTHEVDVAVNGIVPNQAKIKSVSGDITLTAQWVHVPEITASETARAFGDRKVNGGPYEMTLNVSGSYLTENISLTISGTNAAMFSVSPSSLTPTTGTVSSTEITVSYSPTGAGSHTATLTISSAGATSKTVALTGTGKWEVTWNNNGETSTTLVANSTKPTFPSTPSSCDATSTTFVGWATSRWDGKLASLAGKTVHTAASTMSAVTANGTTYYAVFAKGTGSPSDEWQLVTNANQLNEGDKIVFATGSSSTVYLMGYQVDTYEDDGVTPKSRNRRNATNTESVSSSKITLTSSEIATSTDDAAKPYVLTLGKNGDYWTLYDDVYGGYLYAASPAATAGTGEKNWIYYRASDSDAASRWSISVSGTATILSQRTTSNRVYLKFNSGISSCYQSTTDGTTYGYIFRNLSDISYSDYMTTCCDKKVAITDGSLSHCTLAYSSANQQTCSSTAADRQVTVTVTPSTGYGMSGSDRLTFTKTSGTATATYISGPTGSGPYTFVYQFAQNDNGAGTFSATCTAKTYTVTLNNQSATTAGTPNISVTFDANTNLTGTPAITVPTKTGYNFGGYYTGTSGSGTQIIAANGTVNASAGGGSTYTDASKNWKYANNIELYAKWTEKDLTNYRTECGLDIDVEGSVWLTSYAGVEVYTTEESENLITIDCDDFGDATRLGVAYLLNGSPVTYTSSPFRLCWYNFADKTNYNKVDADGSAGSASPYRYYPLTSSEKTALGSSQTFAISYKPGASEYNQEDTYTLRIAVLDGSGNDLGHKDLELHGRALPQKFVIAANIGGQWRALPADLATSAGTAVQDAYPIQVDNESTPTTAIAPKTAVYSGYTRNNGAQHRGGIRLQTQVGDGKDGYLEAPRSNSLTYLRRTTSSDGYGMQEWYLKAKTTEFGLYNISLDPACTLADGTTPITRYLCVYSNQIYWGAQSAKDFRILPVTEYVPVEVQVVEWNTDKIRFMYLGDPDNEAEVKINNVTKAATAELSTLKIDEGVYEIAVSDLTTNAYKQMHIIIKSSGTEVGRKAVNVPLMVNSTTTVASAASGFTKGTQCPQMDLIVLSGGKLTADDATAYQFKTITVYGGGKLIVDASKGLTAKEAMNLRAGGVNVATKGATPSTSYIYTYPQVYIGSGATLTVPGNIINFDYLTNYEQYFGLSLPYPVAINATTDIFYPEDIYGAQAKRGSFLLRVFDSKIRAAQGAVDAVWVDVEEGSTASGGSIAAQTSTVRGLGYTMLGVPLKVSINGGSKVRQKYGIHRMKMDVTSASAMATAENTDASIAVTAYSAGQIYNSGWWLLGNPYMADLNGSGLGGASITLGSIGTNAQGQYEWQNKSVRYVTVPDDAGGATYDQRPVSEYTFPAFKPFYVQIGSNGTVTFTYSSRKADAPQRFKETSMPNEIETSIALNSQTSVGDTAHILIGDAFSDEYEIGDDLLKMPHADVNLFTISGANDLFANALNKQSALSGIPVGYIAPTAGTYEFTVNDKIDNTWIKNLWLTDLDLSAQVDLLVESYEFETDALTNKMRFILNIELKSQEDQGTTTGVDNTYEDYEQPMKFIYQDKFFILLNGKLYDATGKRVREINK